jgi:hypothetical protein
VTEMNPKGSSFPCLQEAAAGWQTIHLEACIYEEFDELAQKWVQQFAGQMGEIIHGLDQCQCVVLITGTKFWIAYDVWQSCISLEPQDSVSAERIPKLFEQARCFATRV